MKLLSTREYQKLTRELKAAQQRQRDLEVRIRELESANQKLHQQLAELEDVRQEAERLRREKEELAKRIESTLNQEIEDAIAKSGLSRESLQKLILDRQELIELYVQKLYSLAKEIAIEHRRKGYNRGLFLILVDRKNMQDTNFSPFHEGQEEFLDNEMFHTIEKIPHIFSQAVREVLDYMTEKEELRDESGNLMGYRERDGALLIDLRGVAFRSCQMVEGVRTHKVYNRVERLRKGSARHNAAIYASSLDEVMAALVISEETGEVTLFRDGKFIQSYDPYTDVEEIRREEQKVVPIQRAGEKAAAPASSSVKETSAKSAAGDPPGSRESESAGSDS